MQADTSHDAAFEAPPDFRHVETWIFDLDNTLYRLDSGIYKNIGTRMTSYIGRALGVAEPEAERIRDLYLDEHGATLTGLIARHSLDPEPFLAYVHDIDLSELRPDGALQREIARLPGRKFVFTNSCRNHAARVLDRIALAHLIEDIWDIRTMAFTPKPAREAYDAILQRTRIDPANAALFEDSPRNLVPAHDLGMTTVWLNAGWLNASAGPVWRRPPDRAYIHYEISDLAAFLRTIRI